MFRKILIGTGVVLAVLATSGYLVYAGNAAPIVATVSASAAADPNRPFIIKLHAQWCPICLVTRDVWSELAAEYEGQANLVVFDFTNEASTRASEAEANRLGLGAFFAEYAGMSGAIAVIDGASRETLALVTGNRDVDEYRAAIRAADVPPRHECYSQSVCQ
jgi:thiol-disulfide isomerase/thioredoxin